MHMERRFPHGHGVWRWAIGQLWTQLVRRCHIAWRRAISKSSHSTNEPLALLCRTQLWATLKMAWMIRRTFSNSCLTNSLIKERLTLSVKWCGVVDECYITASRFSLSIILIDHFRMQMLSRVPLAGRNPAWVSGSTCARTMCRRWARTADISLYAWQKAYGAINAEILSLSFFL